MYCILSKIRFRNHGRQLVEIITKDFAEYLAKTDQFASNIYNKTIIHGSQNCEENTRHAGEGHKETSSN